MSGKAASDSMTTTPTLPLCPNCNSRDEVYIRRHLTGDFGCYLCVIHWWIAMVGVYEKDYSLLPIQSGVNA